MFVEEGMLHGRGACDAKGIAAAMIAAARTLRERGQTGFGLLFRVGQETSFDGAVAADALVASGHLAWPCRFALLGEPTDNSFVTAHPGVVLATLRTYGTAASAEAEAEVEVTCACMPTRFERFPLEPAKPEPENNASLATEAPFLRQLGQQWLSGPGGIDASHSDEECIAVSELMKAHDRYVAWTEAVLAL